MKSSPAWFWSASAPSSRRLLRPATSDRRATDNRGIASGTYLACYFSGGLIGTAVLGRLFDSFGWQACVAGVGVALGIAGLLTVSLRR